MNLHLRTGLLSLLLVGCGVVAMRGGRRGVGRARRTRPRPLGAFMPVGIRIGEDAMKRLDAHPRELSVVY